MLVEQKPQGMARYLDIRIEPAAAGLENMEPFDLLVPIGNAMVTKGGTGVSLPTVASGDIATLPRLGEGPVTWEREMAVAKAFGVKEHATSPSSLYAHPQFDLAIFQQQHAVSK